MPLFLSAKVNNSKSEIRTRALIVSQRVFDNIRSKSITTIPINDGLNSPVTLVNPVSQPVNVNAPTTEARLITYAMGRQYQKTVTYCENKNTDPTVCGDKYRKFKVEVKHNGTKVYDLEGNFTDFQQSP